MGGDDGCGRAWRVCGDDDVKCAEECDTPFLMY